MLKRCQSNLRLEHRKLQRKSCNTFRGLRTTNIVIDDLINHLDVVRYWYFDFSGCLDSRKLTFGYIFQLAKGEIQSKLKLLL